MDFVLTIIKKTVDVHAHHIYLWSDIHLNDRYSPYYKRNVATRIELISTFGQLSTTVTISHIWSMAQTGWALLITHYAFRRHPPRTPIYIFLCCPSSYGVHHVLLGVYLSTNQTKWPQLLDGKTTAISQTNAKRLSMASTAAAAVHDSIYM